MGVTVPLIPALGRQKQVDLCKFKATQGYTIRPYLKINTINHSVKNYQIKNVRTHAGIWDTIKQILKYYDSYTCSREVLKAD